MIRRSRARRDRVAIARWSRTSASILALGGLVSVGGAVLAVNATPVEAATVSCSATHATTPLVPGASGRCIFSYAETAQQAQHQRFSVTLDVNTFATSGGASGKRASEALLDGRGTGLNVSISDSARNTFGVGIPSCTGTYPKATPCASTDHGQAVRGAVDITHWSDTFTVAWSLPRSAGNPYQGGRATITLTAYFNGISDSSASPSPSPTGGLLAASTPATGVGFILVPALLLIAAGIGLLLLGGTRIPSVSPPRRPAP
jgi:hypothetical protein